MTDKDRLIELILSDEKLKKNDNVYCDVPLLRRGSQIKKPETPHKIKEMKELAFTKEAMWKTSAWLFYTQGCFMADYTDDLTYNEDFVKYYVTYTSLTTEQLRGYFTWRTAVRNGSFPEAPMPFVLLYAHELINNIGVSSHMEGYEKLRKLYNDSSVSCQAASRYISGWLSDYVIYYGLDVKLLREDPELRSDLDVITLMHCNELPDEEVCQAMLRLSAYRAEGSRFVKEYTEDYRKAAVKLFREMSAYYEKHRKNSLCTNLFGQLTVTYKHFFENAVFYEKNKYRDADVKVNEIRSYTCRKGVWQCRSLRGELKRNKKLGDLLKALDCLMRKRYNYTYKLKSPEISKLALEMTESILQELEEEKRRAKAAVIEIDLSALSGIRTDADTVRDKLLTEADTEPDDEPDFCIEEELPETYEETDVSPEEGQLLDKAELSFLKALIFGGDWAGSARSSGYIPSVLADSINEKLFDQFGDTIIDFSEDIPQIVEDYLEEMRTLIENGEL